MQQKILAFPTDGRGTTEITDSIAAVLAGEELKIGLCHAFIRHTSASLIICENADPSVRKDLERFTARWIPDGDRLFEHDVEGPDDMPAHLRTIFTQTALTIPIHQGRLALGTWQGVYLWEHRRAGSRREVVVTVTGGD